MNVFIVGHSMSKLKLTDVLQFLFLKDKCEEFRKTGHSNKKNKSKVLHKTSTKDNKDTSRPMVHRNHVYIQPNFKLKSMSNLKQV